MTPLIGTFKRFHLPVLTSDGNAGTRMPHYNAILEYRLWPTQRLRPCPLVGRNELLYPAVLIRTGLLRTLRNKKGSFGEDLAVTDGRTSAGRGILRDQMGASCPKTGTDDSRHTARCGARGTRSRVLSRPLMFSLALGRRHPEAP
jgi:hypothetical protein